MSKNEDFKKYELCWAKIKGFPWWPALIREIKFLNNEKYYNIGYICESKGSDLAGSNIKKWKENYDLFKQGWTLPKDKKSLKQNDFDCSLAMADKLSEGKITPEEHDKFIMKYKTKKERHSLYNIHEFIKELEAEKNNKEKKEIKNSDENKENKKNSEKKKFIGRKRKEKVIEISDDENKSENVKEAKESKESKELKDVEIEMSKKDLNKTDNLVKNITNNLDEIIIKTEKYQKFFEKECKDKNISYLDDKNIKTKIELVKYIQIMNDVFDTPIKLEKTLDINNDNNTNNNSEEKEKLEKEKEIVKDTL
mgnify:FL=1